MMDKPIFVDFETKICSAYLNAVAATVWDALGQATNPQEARQFIGAVEEAPTDGSSYARQNAQWIQIQVGNLHNDLTGRSAADAHPVSAITGLQASLDQINLDLSGKAPASAGTAAGTSFSPTGSIVATNVQSAIAEVSGDVTALQATVAGLGTPAASAVTFSPTGTVAATNVQSAIAELDGETQTALGGKVALSGGVMTGPLTATALTSNGQLESKSIGFKFPDATVQATAAYGKNEFRSGQVLQIVTHFDDGAAQSASGWINLTSVAASITPKSTNSKLIVECFADAQVNNVASVNAQAAFQIYSGTGPPPAGNFGNFVSPRAPTGGGGVGINCGVALMGVVANTDLTPKSYRLSGSPVTGLPNIIGGTQQAWKITEVQN